VQTHDACGFEELIIRLNSLVIFRMDKPANCKQKKGLLSKEKGSNRDFTYFPL
jgi:hypothetical protein